MTNLTAQLGSLEEGQRCLVVGNAPSFERYREVLDRFADRCTLVDADAGPLPELAPPELVVALGRTNAETHRFYARCDAFKRQGIPVVFGNDERGLVFQAPNWRSADLTVAGMFFLASGYLPSLSARGSYVEFGVFDGRSFTLACHALRTICDTFYAFDSFTGIVGASADEESMYRDAAYFANEETFWHNMAVAGVADLPIRVVPGAFQETLTAPLSDHGIERISIVHIDSDVYEAAILALDAVTPYLINGSLLLFDEFHAFGADDTKGERRALREWLERNPDISVEVYRNYTAVARSYIVHRART